MSNSYDQFETILAHNSLRITQPRIHVFNALHYAETPLSAPALAAACPTIDKASIYRTLELFIELHIVAAVPFGWKQRYELMSPFKAHHHHLHCTQCGAVIDIHSAKIEKLIADIASQHKFAPSGHHFEINGLCKACQSE